MRQEERRTATRNPVNALAYFTFDAVGNRTSAKDPVARLNYFYYDTLNRTTAAEDGLAKRTYFTYDAVGSTTSIKDPRGDAQYFTYDALHRRSSFKDEVGQVWYFDYDADSNLSVQRNPLGAFTYWEYDADDRKQSQKDPLARAWYWTYDAVGNASSMKDGKAQTTYYQFDSVNLQHRIDYPDATNHYFEYDNARQQTAFADPSGRTTLAYDNLGRMTTRANPNSQTLYFEYDSVGNRTNLKDPDGFVAVYKYDAANRLTEAGSTGYGNQPYGRSPYGGYVSYYEYDLADQKLHERRANATVSYYGYDAAGRTSLIEHRKSDGTGILRYDYTRDEAGNITLSTRAADSMRTYWNYDQANRITREAWRTNAGTNIYGFDYAYDGAGNRTYKSNTIAGTTTYWEYDLADQMTAQKLGGTTKVDFTFDANGNLSVENDADAGRTYYDYDPRNLLTRVDFPGATATNYFTYNAPGERIRKDDSTAQKKYVWDGIVPILEKNLSDTTTQRMVKGQTPIAGIGEYALQEVSGTVLYPHLNQVGTTNRHTDGSQNIVNYYEYDGWGVPIETTQGTSQQYRYGGQRELDPDSVASNSQNARYHFPVRVYVPFRGAFVQIDPVARIPGTLLDLGSPIPFSVYSYVGGDPTGAVDPKGLVLKLVNQQAKGTFEDMLAKICPEGGFSADGSGNVQPKDRNLCYPEVLYLRCKEEWKILPAGCHGVQHKTGCCCLCDLIKSSKLTEVMIVPPMFRTPTLSAGGVAVLPPLLPATASGATYLKSGRREGNLVVVESPNNAPPLTIRDQNEMPVDREPDDPWSVLAHELCDHALTGLAHPQVGTEAEDAIRREAGLKAGHGGKGKLGH